MYDERARKQPLQLWESESPVILHSGARAVVVWKAVGVEERIEPERQLLPREQDKLPDRRKHGASGSVNTKGTTRLPRLFDVSSVTAVAEDTEQLPQSNCRYT